MNINIIKEFLVCGITEKQGWLGLGYPKEIFAKTRNICG